jgi:hypothetical protein
MCTCKVFESYEEAKDYVDTMYCCLGICVCDRILFSLSVNAIEFKCMLKFNTEITTCSYTRSVLLKDMYSLTEDTHLRLCAFYP